jgi:2-polyprenyl-3-methyl-5-hydroxy-6-metoxy-1,4-benzoquinol methylase
VTSPGPGCCEPRYSVFDEGIAQEDLDAYREEGADLQTADLLAALTREGLQGASAVDIGAGVGAIGHGLITAGVAHLTDVDGSPAYLEAARAEAERLGTLDRWEFREGDYVALAGDIGPADVVTLGRVLCCYADWQPLVVASTAHATRLYAVVYPVSRWWLRLAATLANPILRLTRKTFFLYVHPDRKVDAAIRAAGFEQVHARRWAVWQTAVYRRIGSVPPA